MSGAALSSIRLLAFLSDAESVAAIRALVEARRMDGVVIETGDIATATRFLASNPSPQMLLVALPEGDAAAAPLDALADVLNPHCKVIATGTTDTLRYYQWLMGLGLHEYLLAPFTSAQLGAALDKHALVGAATPTAPTAKKLIAVIGARGGVGTTTIATNLAAMFALEQQQKTALVDLDPHFGSVALGLDLEPGRGMRDALEKPDRVDGLFLDRVLIKPFPNLAILSAEEPLSETIAIDAAAGKMLFDTLAETFPIIVADVPRQMTPLSRHVLAHADSVILVAQPHLMDLRDALRLKDFLVDQLKRPAPLLVINREGLGGAHALSVADFAKHFGQPPAAQLRLIHEAYAASAEGELLVTNDALTPALASLRALAARVSGVEALNKPVASGGGLLAKLMQRKAR